MAGFPTDRTNIDGKIGYLAVTIRDALEEAARVKMWLDTQTEGDLTARGYTSGEVSEMKSAYTDFYNLREVANARETVPVENNFLFWASRLTGLN